MSNTKQGSSEKAEEFGWHVHSALEGWTARVDSKASIAIGIQTAALGFVIALSDSNGPLDDRSGWRLWLLRLGVIALFIAIGVALMVFVPQIRKSKLKDEAAKNTIFFGHIQHWEANKLSDYWQSKNFSPVDELARQTVAMSKIAFKKHRLMQLSMMMFAIAVVSLFVSSL